jgi:tRNA (mo5U34)-methyltransferase
MTSRSSSHVAEPADGDARRELAAAIAGRDWYHTIELAPGLETPGWYDCRRVANRLLPASCDGLRCLDIGTFDGFWAFEMERRGAAEVVAIDILDERRWDWPARTAPAAREAIAGRKGAGDGFLLAREALGSRAERLDASVLDLDPAEHGSFDLIYLGSLLLHLRDPITALERVREVCRGQLIAADAINLPISWLPFPLARLEGVGRPYWWEPNPAAFARMVHVAGFDVVEGPRRYLIPPGRGLGKVPITRATLANREARELIFASRFGDPHAWLRAVPARL